MRGARNNEKGFGVVEVLLAVVVIGLLGVVGWIFLSRQKSITNNASKTQVIADTKKGQHPNASTLKPEDVTEKLKANWAHKYRLVDLNSEGLKPGELGFTMYKTSPPYKVDGFDFYTNYEGGSTLQVSPYIPNPGDDTLSRTADTALRNEIANVYKDLGLTKTETRGDETNRPEDVYMGKGLICTVEPSTLTSINNTASCGLIEAYKASAEKIKLFAALIPGDNSSTLFGALKITDSPVSGYQTASISMINVGRDDKSRLNPAAALLYKKTPGSWVYFKNVQTLLQCSDYNTTDLKNAFKGERCFAGANNNEAIVQ